MSSRILVPVSVILAALSVPVGRHVEAVTLIRLHGAAGWGRPAADATMVFYLTRTHELLAVDRSDGQARWRRTLGSGPRLTAGSQVVVDRDVVVAGDGDLFAFDRATGALRWQFASSELVGVGRYLGAAAAGMVYAGSQSGRVVAVDIQGGGRRWTSASLGGRATVFAPVVHGNRVAAGFTDFADGGRVGGVLLVDAESGAEQWRVQFPARGRSTRPVFGGGLLFMGGTIVAAASDGTLYGLARSTGRIQWATAAGAPAEVAESESVRGAEDHRATAEASGTLLVTSLTGTLVGVGVASREERWRFQSPQDGSIAFAVSASKNTAYVPFASGRTIAIDVASGRERWTIGGHDRRFEWPAAIVDGRVYLTSEDGLYVVDDRAR